MIEIFISKNIWLVVIIVCTGAGTWGIISSMKKLFPSSLIESGSLLNRSLPLIAIILSMGVMAIPGVLQIADQEWSWGAVVLYGGIAGTFSVTFHSFVKKTIQGK